MALRPAVGLFTSEVRMIAARAVEVWAMVPRRLKWSFLAATVVMAVGSASNVGIPLMLGWLIDNMQAGAAAGLGRSELIRTALAVLAGIAGLVFAREGLNVLRRFLVENTCTKIDKHLNVLVVSHLLRTDLGYLTHEKVGAIHGRVCRSIEGFIRFLRVSFLDFFPALLTGGLALGATLVKQPWMALAMVAVIPVSLSITAWQLLSQKGIRLRIMRSREELDGTIVEQLGGIDYVRAADTLDREVGRVEVAAENRRSTEIKHHFEMSLFGASKAITEGFFHVVVLGSAVLLAIDGRIGYGEILTYSILFLNVMAPLSEIHRVLDEGHESSLRVADLLAILNSPVDRSFETPETEPVFDTEAPAIEVRDLHADYRLDESRRLRVLNEVSISIKPGETIGVAGCSGSGKSTWLKVILRLLHPVSGAVRVRGVPLENLSRKQISKMFGYVSQNPFLFAGTIEENIRYGCGGGTFADVIQAARRAGIHDEIEDMPDGYATRLAERGQNLSGGQRQRIALARVFLKNPPILILDEATSALDTINERHVQRAIEAAMADRTVILVAHRLSTLADADRILVFEEGRVAESGTYKELLARNGVFASLVEHAKGEATVDQSPEHAAVQTAI
ncbi:MAG: ABC transporter ATP-binding protein/permease [Gemmataceae bacterium]|nr:ABC transporter ATP-binding protein/permease [Gemmataceae bacterium]